MRTVKITELRPAVAVSADDIVMIVDVDQQENKRLTVGALLGLYVPPKVCDYCNTIYFDDAPRTNCKNCAAPVRILTR